MSSQDKEKEEEKKNEAESDEQETESKNGSKTIKKKKYKYKSQEKPRDFLYWLKFILMVFGVLILGFGIYCTICMFIPLGGFFYIISAAVGQVSGFLIFFFLLAALLLIKVLPSVYHGLSNTRDQKIINSRIKALKKIIISVGIILSVIASLPLAATPISIQNAEDEFQEVYGDDWELKIPQEIKTSFMTSRFNLFNYYLGIPQSDCEVKTDIEYYTDNEIYLSYDVYYPKPTEYELPGHNSTIIKIHGGGWTEGDKGLGNMLHVNKYLASQGYIVFDIQYGLLDTGEDTTLPTPDHVRGDFTLHDMVFHIGYFTHQLEDKLAARYQASLDSVFIMGGSAGGHLTGVVGLGYNDPYFSGNFSNAVNLRGIVPIYPANDAKRISSGDRDTLIPGTPKSNPLTYEKFTPSKLADKNDPATLIYHGLQDGIVDPQESKDIENSLEDKNVDCIRLTFPFAAHASDFLANTNFAQVWMFYLERFLYLQQDL